MATSNIPGISDAQLTELEKLARAQERTVDEVLGEPWTNTLNRSSWAALKNTDVPSRASWASPRRNVPCLIAESRQSAVGKWFGSLRIPISTSAL